MDAGLIRVLGTLHRPVGSSQQLGPVDISPTATVAALVNHLLANREDERLVRDEGLLKVSFGEKDLDWNRTIEETPLCEAWERKWRNPESMLFQCRPDTLAPLGHKLADMNKCRKWSKHLSGEAMLAELVKQPDNQHVVLFCWDPSNCGKPLREGLPPNHGTRREQYDSVKSAIEGLKKLACPEVLIQVSEARINALTANMQPAHPTFSGVRVDVYKPKFDGKPIDALIFKGGGTRGIVYQGAMKCLEDWGMRDSIKYFAGTSAGSQYAAFAAFGLSSQEMFDINRKAPWEELLDYDKFLGTILPDPKSLTDHFGLCRGDALEEFLEKVFVEKLERASGEKIGRGKCTFRLLHDKTGNDLKIGVCNLVSKTFEILDKDRTPDMPVSKACRASSSIPFVFSPVEYGDAMYIDGGLEGNLPATAFPAAEHILAFNLTSKREIKERREKPSNLMEFAKVTLSMLLDAAQGRHGIAIDETDGADLDKRGIHVVNIDIGDAGILDTSMDDATKSTMEKSGYTAVNEYLSSAGIGMGRVDNMYHGWVQIEMLQPYDAERRTIDDKLAKGQELVKEEDGVWRLTVLRAPASDFCKGKTLGPGPEGLNLRQEFHVQVVAVQEGHEGLIDFGVVPTRKLSETSFLWFGFAHGTTTEVAKASLLRLFGVPGDGDFSDFELRRMPVFEARLTESQRECSLAGLRLRDHGATAIALASERTEPLCFPDPTKTFKETDTSGIYFSIDSLTNFHNLLAQLNK